jgi:hypothetical protein
MTRRGRPRGNLEPTETRQLAERNRAWAVSEVRRILDDQKSRSKRAFQYAIYAARTLYTLESGTPGQKLRCEGRIRKLRNTKWGYAIDPYKRMRAPEFLEVFIERCEPGWQWRAQIDNRPGANADARFAKGKEWLARNSKARRSRFITPDDPDTGRLTYLRLIKPNDPTTWPTLRELKIATAIPERTIQKVVASVRSKEAEIVRIPLRHKFAGIRRGAFPKRYGPRLVLAVLETFVDSLRTGAVGNESRKTAMIVKRALTSKLSRSRSSI